VEGGPVDAAVVTLEHVLHHGVRLPEEVWRAGGALKLRMQAVDTYLLKEDFCLF
jgi:hypothetical protein